MLIFLIGMPGSGKSTTAKALGVWLNQPVWDTDDMIEKSEGKSISKLFSEEGESHFRLLEHQLITEWPHSGGIVATGGGLPCFKDNMTLLKKMGLTVYIKADPETLTKRLTESSKRPLVTQASFQEIYHYVAQTISERSYYYEQAHIIITGEKNIQDTVETIILEISEYKRVNFNP
jgi:shikimate kinase